MASKVDAATIVVATLREQVAALHAAADPAERLTGAVEEGGVVEGGAVEGGVVEGGVVEGEVGGGEADQRLALRDAARDLRALLEDFDPLLDDASAWTLRDDLDRVLGLLGPLVAGDEAHELVDDLLDDLDPTLVNGPVTTRMSLAERDREQGASRTVVELLASPQWAELLERADRLVIDAPLAGKAGKGAKPVLLGLLADRDREMAEALAALDQADEAAEPVAQAEGREQAVAAGVRLTLLADAARPVHGKHARRLADASRDVVEAAVDYASATGAARLLVDLADQAHRAGEPGFSYGRLHAAADRRRAAALDELADAQRAWAKPKRHKWLHD